MKTPKTPEKAHALISPSASGRVMKCPASLLASLFVPKTTNKAAERGTELHAAAEVIIANYIADATLPEVMDDSIVDYVKHVIQLIEHSSFFRVEARLPMNYVAPIAGQFGTADFVALVERTLYVNDLKTGKAEVSPFNNTQLRHYGIGAVELLEQFYVDRTAVELIDNVKLGISQNGSIEYEDITLDELLQSAADYRAKYVEALSPNPSYNMGDHCKYCPAKATCPEQNKQAIDSTSMPLTHLLPDDLVSIYRRKKDIKEYLDAVEERLLAEAVAGTPAAGTCLKPGIVRRAWSDERLVLDEIIATRTDWLEFVKPVGITEALDKIPELQKFVIKPEPKMVLALTKK